MVRKDANSQHFFIVAGVIVIIDQLCKLIITKGVDNSVSVIGDFLKISNIHNYGAGFGILQGQQLLLIIASTIVIGLIVYFHKYFGDKSYAFFSMAYILGGSVGNLIDRVLLGYVVDFINFSFWPAFNIADSAITIGSVGIIIYLLKK